MVEAGNRPQSADVDSDVANPVAGGAMTPGGTAIVTGGPGRMLLADSVLDRRYRLIDVLSARGPVTLWSGDDTVLTRPVAVRVVERSDDPSCREAAQALLNAAVTSGRLVHPGAASTYDATVTDTEYGQVSYVITEWVDGRTVRELVQEGPLPPTQAARIVLDAARVILAAHERGLRHGGLHPGDVIVSSHGTVKVIDLEVGGVLASFDGSAQPGADPAAEDVRALGGVLYAALTGCWPLGGDAGLPPAPYGTYGRLQSPRQLNHAVGRDLDAIAMAAISGEEQVNEPITTAAQLIAELEAVIPPEALHDTSLMGFGDEPPRTEEMAGGYGPDTSGMPSTSNYAAPGPDGYGYGYDDRYGGQYANQGYEQGGYGYGGQGYPEEAGYPPAQRGYPPAAPRPEGGGRAAAREERRSGGRKPVIIGVAVAVVAVIVLAIVLALQLGGGSGGGGAGGDTTTTPPVTAGAALTPTSVVSFDPQGDGSENPDDVPLLTDGNASTEWTTDGYNVQASGVQFGGIKQGVGIKVAFDKPVHPSQIVLTVGTLGPETFEIHAADADGAAIDAFPIVGSPQTGTAGQQVKVDIPESATAQYWVIWLTNLPQDTDNAAKTKGSFSEIQFLS